MTGVSELVLEVAELERAERFYEDELGLPVVERWPHRNAVWVLAGSTRIGLWEPQVGLEGSQGGKHVHFALQVADEDFEPLVDGAPRAGPRRARARVRRPGRGREPEPLGLRHRPRRPPRRVLDGADVRLPAARSRARPAATRGRAEASPSRSRRSLAASPTGRGRSRSRSRCRRGRAGRALR